MADPRRWNAKFSYQVTDYMSKEALQSFLEPFIMDKRIEQLHYVIKKNGNVEEYAIFTKGEEILNDHTAPSRRRMVEINNSSAKGLTKQETCGSIVTQLKETRND